MPLKDQLTRTGLYLSLFVFALGGFLPDSPASSHPKNRVESGLPLFSDFVKQVHNGDAAVLRGVYVQDVLALPVAQQPEGNANYVSRKAGEATQFSTASHFGTIGLLAHNNLSGRSFSALAVGHEVRLVHGDGRVEDFIVADVLRFQALDPASPWSTFRDVITQEVLSTRQMFDRVYSGTRHVTFQTCIESNGNLNWGRLFVLALPKELHSRFSGLGG